MIGDSNVPALRGICSLVNNALLGVLIRDLQNIPVARKIEIKSQSGGNPGSVSAAIAPTGLMPIIIPASMITASLFLIICIIPPLYGGGISCGLPMPARRISDSRFKQSIVGSMC